MWQIAKFLGRIGLFTYRGARDCQPDWWPKARVRYKDGNYSAVMAIGNAWGYARIFHGEVVRP
jgi:hypothetical protein